MNNVIACIDGSEKSTAVCDAAIWAAQRLEKPLLLLHTIERTAQETNDFSGAIGLGAKSELLKQLVELDEQRGKLALEHGKQLLQLAMTRATQAGLSDSAVSTKQRHGDIVDALAAIEADTRFIVLGRSGQNHEGDNNVFKTIGSHIETAVRSLHRSILMTDEVFKAPSSFMLAYDGRETANRALARVISGGLLKGLPCHLVMIANHQPAQEQQAKLEKARQMLDSHGYEVSAHFLEGTIFDTLMEYRQKHQVDLLLMGAFSHSKVRQFFLGSNTLKMIQEAAAPLIVLK